MARRKEVEQPRPSAVGFPDELRRGVATVESFVPSWELPPAHWSDGALGGDDAWWRQIRAWRRWQAAVEQWGEENGLSRVQLMALRVWPSSPLWFGPGR